MVQNKDVTNVLHWIDEQFMCLGNLGFETQLDNVKLVEKY